MDEKMIKEHGQSYAVYWEGAEERPSGIVNDITKEGLDEISKHLCDGRKYRLEPVTPEEAQKIEDSIHDSIMNQPLSPAVEAIFEEHRKKQHYLEHLIFL